MIYAAAFVAIKDDKILLTRTRDNTIWYQAGGKIEQNETPIQTIVRELKEELSLELTIDDMRYLGNITTDNHDRTTTVSLECFTADINQEIKPCAEISAIKWFDFDDTEFVAPAVLEVIAKYKSGEWQI
ncbi:NUDIX hydrolase [Francisella philomiragia]|uniref:NUDIX hydrolase n=1 Tax=Francisella philomiragia TaxID=28110 RepID=UPI00190453F8|nr:NUDIX domain-containing protein [Francisella philomiragia]MBK2092899.1 NUDIX domain-containing protein [Francisella philomiragia]MBK2257459.1 NUDIX domain-containing protein [Francisella philomiragia]MBK2270116.1 NUDIX domain-containing protein [Francisella philomiragia]MBK2271675.1 NUDIX domain-containing protein [Francisella philomiragia]MBK2275456.1 NUDIX domain-containing protein [Francisella philomiragia]